jgi:3-methyladenine DNA glycosylase/8-oxoguanine DNA glycosylase
MAGSRPTDRPCSNLPTPKPFELRLALFGHGFVDLAPHRWDPERAIFHTVVDLGSRAVDVQVCQTARGLRADVRGRASGRAIERTLVRMLRLDEDLSPFWKLCARDPRFRWVARRGAGRLLRSPTLFEDLAKLLMTTNCSWAATRNMVTRITEALGRPAPSGARAFPSAEACAERNERFYRDTVRMGYRAASMTKLARAFADAELESSDFEDPALSSDALRARLLALPGFGPYAAGQALRLLGHYDDYALDSWCRAELALRSASGRAPSDRAVARRYDHFGRYRGLALWMDLTARWHAEGDR